MYGLFFAWRCCTISAKEKETLLNEEITAKEVRLIGPAGETLGIMSASRALEQAYDRGMDLVMMSAQAVPPVCKIMDSESSASSATSAKRKRGRSRRRWN